MLTNIINNEFSCIIFHTLNQQNLICFNVFRLIH